METLGLSGVCIVESVETLGSYIGSTVESVNIASVLLLKYRAPISLGCCSLVDISLGSSVLGFISSSSVSLEGVA